MQRPEARFRLPALLALGVLLEAALVALVATAGRPRGSNGAVLACLAAAIPFYLMAVGVAWRPGRSHKRLILGFAVLFRLTLLPLTPSFSHDLNRFRWDGKLQSFQTFSFNPYVVAPQDAVLNPIRGGDGPVDSPAIASFRPPLAEIVFRRMYGLAAGLRAQKLPWVGFDLLTLLLLMRMLEARGQPQDRALVFGWSPLVLFEVAGNGHLDAGAAFFALLAVHWLGRRDRWGALALASAFCLQWYALVLLPLYWVRARGRRWVLGLLMLAWTGLVSLPYLFFNKHLTVGLLAHNLRTFIAANWLYNASWYTLATRVAPAAVGAVGLAVWAAAITWALVHGWQPVRVAGLAVGLALGLAPMVFPWFLVFLLPWVVLEFDAAWFYFVLAAPLAYVTAAWHPRVWEYVPVAAWLAWELATGRRREHARTTAA